jgi:hypothetical protein
MANENERYVSATKTAQLLGLTRGRVHQLISEKCPTCGRDGCERCDGTGRRLPATMRWERWLVHRDWDVRQLRDHRTGEELLDEDVIRRWNDGTSET